MNAGTDEVGRGPFAWDVVAAAVILDPAKPISGLADSKKLSLKQRQVCFDAIVKDAHCYAVGRASVEEIERINILQASMLAMERAVSGLNVPVDFVIVDGNRIPDLPCEAEWLIKGDSKSYYMLFRDGFGMLLGCCWEI